MDSFQETTMTVAIILLIICLAAIGVVMYYGQADSVYPPIGASCPDFFKYKKTDDGKIFCEPPSASIPGYKDDTRCRSEFELRNDSQADKCENRQRAMACGWIWDGVTNLGNPCENLTLS